MIDPLFLCGDEIPEIFDPRAYKKKCNKRRWLYVKILILLIGFNFIFPSISAIMFLPTIFFTVFTLLALLVPSSLEFYANELIWEEKLNNKKL